jgi:hypothetical protein
MKRFMLLLICLLFALPSQAELKSGPIQLKRAKNAFDRAAIFTVTVGKEIKADASFYITDFFGRKTIIANARIRNVSGIRRHFAYFVAFFDEKKNLLGNCNANSFSRGLKPGENYSLGSCLISLPPAAIAQVRYYQLRFYEGTRRIGR